MSTRSSLVRPLAPIVCLALVSACGSTTRLVRPSELPVAIDTSGIVPATETYGDADLAHLEVVLDEEQAARYLALTPEQRREMMRVVWASLDPTPTTARNERQEEHSIRLAYVRENFAVDHDPGWDRRGELFLRFGSPQVRDLIPADVVPGKGLIPPKEVWVYTWSETAFRLEDPLLQDDYRDCSDWIESSRTDLVYGSAPIDMGSTYSLEEDAPTIAAEAAWHRMQKMLGKGWHAVRDDTQWYLHDHGGRKLDYVFDVLSFAAADPDRTTMEFNLLLAASDLAYRGHGDDRAAELEVTVVAKTADYREVARAEHVARIAARKDGRVLDRIRLDVEPDVYRLALRVRDRATGNVGIFTTQGAARRFVPGDLSLSDLQLAFRVEPAVTPGRLTKGRTLVLPNPSGQAEPLGSMYLYFEVYGLALSRTGDALYSVALTVRERREGAKRGALNESVSTEFLGRARSADVQESIALDAAALGPGLWEVEVAVTDRVLERTARQSRVLRVVEPEKKRQSPRRKQELRLAVGPPSR